MKGFMLLRLEVTPEEFEWISNQNECRTFPDSGNLEYYGAWISVNNDLWKVYQVKKLREKLKEKLREKLKDHYGTSSTTVTIKKIDEWLANQNIVSSSLEE